jgi:heterodisulfide reductase subunit C
MAATIPNLKIGSMIEKICSTDIRMCWTCKSCLAECPVNIGTNRLQPMKIIRMANLGLLEEMVRLPEIWFCIECRHCDSVCPMSVKPSLLISYLRRESLLRSLFSYESICRCREIRKRFHRSQWLLAKDSIKDFSNITSPITYWNQAEKMSSNINQEKITIQKTIQYGHIGKANTPHVASCLTCGECCSACPVFYEDFIFSPMYIVRQYRLGLIDELLISPSIWLCMDCRRCEEACSQSISPREVIQNIQEQSIKEFCVDQNFRIYFQDACKALQQQMVQEIDSLPELKKAA